MLAADAGCMPLAWCVLGVVPVLGSGAGARARPRLALAGLPGADAAAASDAAAGAGRDAVAHRPAVRRPGGWPSALLWWLRSRCGGAGSRGTSTWGCGYGAPTRACSTPAPASPGTSASASAACWCMLRRQKAPEGYFPTDSYLITRLRRRGRAAPVRGHQPRRRVGQPSCRGQLREDDPRMAFAAALVAIVLIAGAGRAGERSAAVNARACRCWRVGRTCSSCCAMPILMVGLVNRTKSWWGGRKGPRLAAVVAGTCCACCASGRWSARWPRRCSAPGPGWCWRRRCSPR